MYSNDGATAINPTHRQSCPTLPRYAANGQSNANSDEQYPNSGIHVVKPRKRLTREESKEVTHTRLIEAAEWLFMRKGFDDASVDEISETAGYSRGAFYSNFEDKEQVFLALMDRRRPKVLKSLDDIFQEISEPARRIPAV